MYILKSLSRTKNRYDILEIFFADKEDKSVPLQTKNQEKENFRLNDVSYRSWRLGSLYENDNNSMNFFTAFFTAFHLNFKWNF